MAKVFTHMTMSLDGFIADSDNQVGELFDWYEAGEVSVASHYEEVAFDVDAASAEMLRELTDNAGALVSGRRLFDIASGWDDTHPSGAQVVVVTHEAPADAAERWPKTTFVDGVDTAIEYSALNGTCHCRSPLWGFIASTAPSSNTASCSRPLTLIRTGDE